MPAKPKLDKAAKKEARREKRAASKARRRQIWEAFKLQRREDKKLVPLMVGVFLLAVLVVFGIGLIFDVHWLVLPIGIALGVLAAVRRGSLIDQIVRFLGLAGYSIPIFWLGLMGLLLFYAKLGWVAGPGRIDVTYSYLYTPVTNIVLLDTAMQGQWDAFWDAVSHIILPACLLGYFSLAYISRMTRSFMLNELAQEYVIAARVKGLSEMRVIWRHALRNAAVPLITVIALSYANLLEGSVLTETVFAWPGLGQYITNSLQNADMNAVLGGTLVIGAAFVLLNLVSDLLYRLLDPRTR